VAPTYILEIPPDLDFIAMRTLPLYAVTSTYHPLAELKSVSVSALAGHPMVLLDLPMSSAYFPSDF